MKKISLRRASEPEIPTASTADIAFLLIIFFMLTTVFRTERGLKLFLPEAESTERILKRRNTAFVWLDRAGRTTINDNLLDLRGVTSVMAGKFRDNPDLIAVIRADQDIEYGKVNDILEALKEAGVLKVTFATEYERKGG
ncbi:MAG: biopolymer transporter ExbD [candidate division WOR-3 bacterium]|nr:biopolymer transporter ExbD [candidate division WOR-3 bacterium]MDH5684600.1 biopolymer transporter ExbD [candidate division WOR-3 bacterium]